jgi:hypothetical protein
MNGGDDAVVEEDVELDVVVVLDVDVELDVVVVLDVDVVLDVEVDDEDEDPVLVVEVDDTGWMASAMTPKSCP